MEMNNTTNKDTLVFLKNGFEATDDEGQTLKFENGKFRFINSDGTEAHFNKKNHIVKAIFNSIITLLTLIGFLVWGLCFNGWATCWIVWVAMPVFMSIVDVVEKKQLSAFAFHILTVVAYLTIGLYFNGWHPYWFIFLFIPVYYIITESLDKYVFHTKKIEDED